MFSWQLCPWPSGKCIQLLKHGCGVLEMQINISFCNIPVILRHYLFICGSITLREMNDDFSPATKNRQLVNW